MDEWLGHMSTCKGVGCLGSGTSPLDPMAYGRDRVDASMLEFEVVGEMSQLLARTGEYNKFLSSCSHKRVFYTAHEP